MSLLGKLQPGVRRETKKVAVYTLIGLILMLVVFFALHLIFPAKIRFDYRVILGGIGGSAMALLNFYLMALSVQKIAEEKDSDKAQKMMKLSYSRRSLLQMLWVVIAIVAPCFQFAAGMIPLVFPGTGIKLAAIFKKKD